MTFVRSSFGDPRDCGGMRDEWRKVLGMVEWGWGASAENSGNVLLGEKWRLTGVLKHPSPSGKGGPTSLTPVLSPIIQSVLKSEGW